MSPNHPILLPTLERDPVCGMSVNPAAAKHVHPHAGKNFYFCCASCAEKFKSQPDKFLSAPTRSSGLVTLSAATPAASSIQSQSPIQPETPLSPRIPSGSTGYACPMCPEVRRNKPGACPSCGMALEPDVPIASSRTEYTCPMHPEIIRATPGSCPICGMALEPRTVTAAPEENPELRDMTRRFWISLALAVPLMVIDMYQMMPGLGTRATSESGLLSWVELALATPVVLWGGWPFFQRFWTSLI